MGDGPKHWPDLSHPARPSPCQRRKFQFHFVAIERYLFTDRDLCPQPLPGSRLTYITCLRDPLKRIESAMRYDRNRADVVESWATRNTPRPKNPIIEGSATVDNFYVRTFAGEDVFLKPLHALSDLDLERAKAVLANFAVVLVLERLNDRDVIQLSQLLGWSITSVKPHQANIKNISSFPGNSANQKQFELSERQRKILRDTNSLDMALYHHTDKVAAAISERCRVAPNSTSTNSLTSFLK
jgi:hypothetical protein